MLQDDVAPAQRERGVRSRAKVQPVVGLAAEVRLARVDADVGVRRSGDVDCHARGVIVVRDGLFGRPLDEDGTMLVNLAPGPCLDVVKRTRKVARTLADLVRSNDVRRAKQLERHAGIGLHAPLSASAAPAEQRLRAVLLPDLADVVSDGLICLVPADAHPARVIRPLGIRALHGVLDAIGVITRLD